MIPGLLKPTRKWHKALTDSVTRSNGYVKFLKASVSEDGLHLKLEDQTGK